MRHTRPVEIGHRRPTTHHYVRTFQLWLAAVSFLAVAAPIAVGAVTSISQGYSTSDKLSLGSIVSLQPNVSDRVVAASTSNADSVLGVVIDANNSLLSLSNDQETQVQVATSGTVQVLVSDINGPIVRGDHITASPINGVGMKATGNVRIVGVAQTDLTASGMQQTYTSKDGVKHSVTVGEVPALVNVSYYFKEADKTIIPSALQNIANALAGKPVSTLPIIISAAIFLVMLVAVVAIIYTMIRSSIISVGRNPMSQSAIYRDLIQLSLLVLAILAVSLIAIYMVLTRL
jgi:hypothetical protein